MNLRGQQFEIDLSEDEEHASAGSSIPSRGVPSICSPFVSDIKERETAPPSAPKIRHTPSGFPEHKKRPRVSAFKQQRAGSVKPGLVDSRNAFARCQTSKAANASSPMQKNFNLDEDRRCIDQENIQRLAAMSPEEIAEERQELISGLDPSVLQMLLKRSNLDEGRGDTGIDPPSSKSAAAQAEETVEHERQHGKKWDSQHRGTDPASHTDRTPVPEPAGKRIDAAKSVRFTDDESEPPHPIGLQSACTPSEPLPSGFQPSIHFPSAPSAPELDPSDPDFLSQLHSKYFPSLPADPSKLAWMAPLPTAGSIADQESPYYPAAAGLNANALRFDFRGGLLPPRIARAVPVTRGLHHHGEAPEAAGYTVPELARLARSAFPAQRCVAFQTLGRLLYRLGRGEWGGPESEITKGLWMCVKGGKVIETLEAAAGAAGGHQGSKAYAVEALWLWQKGGGEVVKAE
ncbi:transcription factor [Diplocarpon rosae]|nr:transcription factor [Diplocarpon rosae]